MKKLLILVLLATFSLTLFSRNSNIAFAAVTTSTCEINNRPASLTLTPSKNPDNPNLYKLTFKIDSQEPIFDSNKRYKISYLDPRSAGGLGSSSTEDDSPTISQRSLTFDSNNINILDTSTGIESTELLLSPVLYEITGGFDTPLCLFNINLVFGTQSNPTNPSDPNAAPSSCTTSVQYFPAQTTTIPGLDGLRAQVIEKRAPYALLKIEGIEKNPELRRGVKIVDRNNQNKLFADYCYPQDDLINGIVLPNPYGNKYWYSGRYDITVTERCAVWLESPAAQGNPICFDENRPTVLSIGEGKPLLEGDPCVVNGPRKCDKSAPHCVPSGYGENEGICKSKPSIANFCDTKDGYCSTIFGKLYFSPAGFARSTLTFLLSISGGILLIYLIISGYKLMTSQGDPDKIKDAREAVTAAIAGILLIIFSIAILQLVTVDILGLPGFR